MDTVLESVRKRGLGPVFYWADRLINLESRLFSRHDFISSPSITMLKLSDSFLTSQGQSYQYIGGNLTILAMDEHFVCNGDIYRVGGVTV